jgi:hypothetical protein
MTDMIPTMSEEEYDDIRSGDVIAVVPSVAFPDGYEVVVSEKTAGDELCLINTWADIEDPEIFSRDEARYHCKVTGRRAKVTISY